ncbi:MAG TPA: DUF5407 family protein [Rhizomicrobium sp.]|jgi:hypothetical protein|nr:DUF5407 family protein [Rhizomicrobium sp.]
MARTAKIARKPARRSKAEPSKSYNIKVMKTLLDETTAAMNEAIDALNQEEAEMNPSDFLTLQFQINLFRQLLETSTNVTAAFNDAIIAVARNLK